MSNDDYKGKYDKLVDEIETMWVWAKLPADIPSLIDNRDRKDPVVQAAEMAAMCDYQADVIYAYATAVQEVEKILTDVRERPDSAVREAAALARLDKLKAKLKDLGR